MVKMLLCFYLIFLKLGQAKDIEHGKAVKVVNYHTHGFNLEGLSTLRENTGDEKKVFHVFVMLFSFSVCMGSWLVCFI
eukprot:UN14479